MAVRGLSKDGKREMKALLTVFEKQPDAATLLAQKPFAEASDEDDLRATMAGFARPVRVAGTNKAVD